MPTTDKTYVGMLTYIFLGEEVRVCVETEEEWLNQIADLTLLQEQVPTVDLHEHWYSLVPMGPLSVEQVEHSLEHRDRLRRRREAAGL